MDSPYKHDLAHCLNKVFSAQFANCSRFNEKYVCHLDSEYPFDVVIKYAYVDFHSTPFDFFQVINTNITQQAMVYNKKKSSGKKIIQISAALIGVSIKSQSISLRNFHGTLAGLICTLRIDLKGTL